MKATGIVRKVDDLGRMVIPKELRKTMNIKPKDAVEIYVEGDKIIFKKYEPGCIFCEKIENTKEFQGEKVCEGCLNEMLNI